MEKVDHPIVICTLCGVRERYFVDWCKECVDNLNKSKDCCITDGAYCINDHKDGFSCPWKRKKVSWT